MKAFYPNGTGRLPFSPRLHVYKHKKVQINMELGATKRCQHRQQAWRMHRRNRPSSILPKSACIRSSHILKPPQSHMKNSQLTEYNLRSSPHLTCHSFHLKFSFIWLGYVHHTYHEMLKHFSSTLKDKVKRRILEIRLCFHPALINPRPLSMNPPFYFLTAHMRSHSELSR